MVTAHGGHLQTIHVKATQLKALPAAEGFDGFALMLCSR